MAASGETTPTIGLPEPAGAQPVLLNVTAGAAFLPGVQTHGGADGAGCCECARSERKCRPGAGRRREQLPPSAQANLNA